MTSSSCILVVAFAFWNYHVLSNNEWTARAFQQPIRKPWHTRPNILCYSKGGGFDESDGATKGFVSALTNLINGLTPSKDKDTESSSRATENEPLSIPTSPTEVLQRIRDDYVKRNYLWTGDLDIASFTTDCTFQDPTIKFQGRDTFLTNVQNIRQISDRILGPCRSDLTSIALRQVNDNDENTMYVETRWRMVGLLQSLPWQPCIDVPGRTKFWIQPSIENNATGWQVYRYEEEWEIPAARALWQIVQPSGVYPQQQEKNHISG